MRPSSASIRRLIDLPGRINWIEGATKVEMSNDEPNQIGKTHRCVRGEEGVELMTTEVKVSDTTMELWETDLKKISACRYLLTRVPGGKADVAVELYVRTIPIVRMIFRVLMEKKLKVFFEKSIANLGELCEKAESMKSRSMRIAVIGQGDPVGNFTARPAKRTVQRICKAGHGNTRIVENRRGGSVAAKLPGVVRNRSNTRAESRFKQIAVGATVSVLIRIDGRENVSRAGRRLYCSSIRTGSRPVSGDSKQILQTPSSSFFRLTYSAAHTIQTNLKSRSLSIADDVSCLRGGAQRDHWPADRGQQLQPGSAARSHPGFGPASGVGWGVHRGGRRHHIP